VAIDQFEGLRQDVHKVIVAECMLNDLTVKLTYIDGQGQQKVRHVEVYEIKNGTLFGFCLTDNHIKQFKCERIVAAAADKPFKPRQRVVMPT
jgi:predicted DNA-binding transcriptional regulator YafY